MSKQYPLEIQNVGEDSYCVMSKGHHDPDEFMTAVKSEGYDWPLGNPMHVWVKTTPSNSDEYESFYTIVEKGTRGSWPATYAWEAYGKEKFSGASYDR